MDNEDMQALDLALLRTRQTLIRRSPTRSHVSGASPPTSPRRSPLLRPRALSQEMEDFVLDSDGPLTVTQATFNLANIIIGVGVLSVPFAFKRSGYFCLVIILLVIYVTSTTGKWIGSALSMASQTSLARSVPPAARDFAFLAEAAFGRRFRHFINFVTVLEVWFACVTFLIMNGGNTNIIWPSVPPSISVPLTGCISTVLCLVPERALSYLSLISTVSLLVAAGAMVTATLMMSDWAQPYQQLGKDSLIHVANIPQAVGIIVFCFAGHPVFPSVYASMKEPSKWDTSMDASFMGAFVFYAALGYLGYIVFGSGLDPTVTENLTGIHGGMAMVCRDIAAMGFLVKVQLTAPLLLNALLVALWPPEAGQPTWSPGRVFLLACVGGLTIVVAVLLRDSVAAAAGLTGSFCVMTTSVLFPAVVHLGLSCSQEVQKPRPSSWMTYVGIVMFGLVMAVLGTASALRDLLGGD